MILNLFRKKKNTFFFENNEWKYDEQKGTYCLRFPIKTTKITAHTRIYLYRKQGERYVFMSQGHESVSDHEVMYYSQQPFSGKVKIR